MMQTKSGHLSPVACPWCGGPWLDGWRWQQVPRRRCPIRAADDARQAADAAWAVEHRPPFTRPTTPTEAALGQLATGTPLDAAAVTVVHAAGCYWTRELGGHLNAAVAAAVTTTEEGNAA